MNFFFVGIGGFLGALSRYYLGKFITDMANAGIPFLTFPYGTLSVNLIGSFLLSYIAYSNILRWNYHHRYILGINTGFIGSFTTFSTFSVDTFNLINHLHYILAFSYVSISLCGGLFLSWLGIYLAQTLYEEKNM